MCERNEQCRLIPLLRNTSIVHFVEFRSFWIANANHLHNVYLSFSCKMQIHAYESYANVYYVHKVDNFEERPTNIHHWWRVYDARHTRVYECNAHAFGCVLNTFTHRENYYDTFRFFRKWMDWIKLKYCYYFEIVCSHTATAIDFSYIIIITRPTAVRLFYIAYYMLQYMHVVSVLSHGTVFSLWWFSFLLSASHPMSLFLFAFKHCFCHLKPIKSRTWNFRVKLITTTVFTLIYGVLLCLLFLSEFSLFNLIVIVVYIWLCFVVAIQIYTPHAYCY